MKLQLPQLILAILCLFAIKCSNDDTPNTTLAGDNGFEVNGVAFVTDFFYLTSDDEIIMSNANLERGTLSGVNIIRFEIAEPSLSEATYVVRESLTECSAIIDATWEDGETLTGQRILDEAEVTIGFMRVLDIDRITQEINVIFEFQRTDGELLAGTYTGSYEIANF